MKKVFETYKSNETGEIVIAAPVYDYNILNIFNELRERFGINDSTVGLNYIIVRPTDEDGKKYDVKIPYGFGTVCILYNQTTKKFKGIANFQLSALYTKVFDIKIKYFSDKIERLRYIDCKSDWIDLRAAETIEFKKDEFKLIPLGIAMELPEGYEAHVVPRGSTFKNYGIIETNSMGIIDETYCGDNDQWFFPAYALRDTVINVNDRICQFRIMKHQEPLMFSEVTELGNPDRGGHGSTGKQ